MDQVSKTTPLLRVICHPFGQTWYRHTHTHTHTQTDRQTHDDSIYRA